MDEKVSRASFKAYRDWQRHILASKPKLSRGIRRVTLVAYCLAMASHGGNGQGCFASDATLADEIGLNEAKRIAPYRHEAIRLGWFVLTGEHRGRVKVLSISIPEDGNLSISEQVSAEHIDAPRAIDCPACVPLLAEFDAGRMSRDDLLKTHQVALYGSSGP